jgi:4-hydroxybenzoate polyprenyltransferase
MRAHPDNGASPAAFAAVSTPRPDTRTLLAVWQLVRPTHWVKNAFVLAPLAFAARQAMASSVPAALLGFASFCLLSSAIYCFNDALDAAADRAHPTKRFRPVASGAISPAAAIGLALALAVCGFGAAARLPFTFGLMAALYVANNLFYSAWLKTRVIADVVSIAIGFVLRLLAGAAAIAVPASSWLIVCGFALALLLGFGKRRAELLVSDRLDTRATLISYTPQKLDSLMSICGSVSLLSYMLYTMAPETIRLHQTDKLIYTIPLVAYGIFRFIFKVQEGKAEDPVSILLYDRALQATIALWVAASLLIMSAVALAGGAR